MSTDVVFLVHGALLTSRPGTLCFWGKRAVEGQKISQIIAHHSIEVSAEHRNMPLENLTKELFIKVWAELGKPTNMR